MDKLTSGDWDYSNAYWELNTARYVSPPSAFKNTSTTTTALLKTTTVPTANLKEGRIETNVNYTTVSGYVGRHYLLFRYQDANNYYWVVLNFYDNYIQWGKVVAGAWTALKTVTPGNFTVDTWMRWRVTWWNDYVGLVIRLEKYVSGAWAMIGDAYDSENLWKDVGGRVGFTNEIVGTATPIWVDDTIIYGIG